MLVVGTVDGWNDSHHGMNRTGAPVDKLILLLTEIRREQANLVQAESHLHVSKSDYGLCASIIDL